MTASSSPAPAGDQVGVVARQRELSGGDQGAVGVLRVGHRDRVSVLLYSARAG